MMLFHPHLVCVTIGTLDLQEEKEDEKLRNIIINEPR